MKHRMNSGLCLDLSEVTVISSYNTNAHGFLVGMTGGRDLQLEAMPKEARMGRDRNEIAKAEMLFKADYNRLWRAWMSFGECTEPPPEEEKPDNLASIERIPMSEE